MRRWLSDRRLVLAVGLVASAPIVVAVVEVVASGWVPYSDDAVVAVRAYDVFTSRSPLLGQWSSGYTAVTGEPTYGLGPLLFWLLAVPARLPWPGSFEITVGVVNVASTLGAVGLAHRRGGAPLMFAVAFGIVIMFASLPTEVYSDIWNPSAALLPMTLLFFLAWSLACGEYRLLPLAVLVGSFVAQCHLGYAIPVLAALGVGVAGLVVSRRSRGGWEGTRPWIVAALVAGVACFSAPLLEQAIHRPGNIVLLGRAATANEPTVGIGPGVRAVVHTVGVVPWWLRDPQVPIERIADLTTGPDAFTVLSALVVCGGLLATSLVGWRRGRTDVVAAGIMGLTLCAALALVTVSTPRDAFPTVGYTLRWAAPLGMWVWVTLGWSAATLLRPVRRAQWTRAPVAIAGVGLLASVASLVAIAGELRDEPHAEMQALNERVLSELRPGGSVRVDVASGKGATFMALGLHAGLVYALRREDYDVTVPGAAYEVFGDDYAVEEGDEGQQAVRIDVDVPPPETGRVIDRLRIAELPDPGDPFASEAAPVRDVSVTLLR